MSSFEVSWLEFYMDLCQTLCYISFCSMILEKLISLTILLQTIHHQEFLEAIILAHFTLHLAKVSAIVITSYKIYPVNYRASVFMYIKSILMKVSPTYINHATKETCTCLHAYPIIPHSSSFIHKTRIHLCCILYENILPVLLSHAVAHNYSRIWCTPHGK